MRRGTRVGQAYVAIAADASNINNDIKDGLDDVDAKGIGKRHGKEYAKSFTAQTAEIEKGMNKTVHNLSRAITANKGLKKAINRMVAESTSPAANQRTRSTWRRLFEHVGEEAGVGFGTQFDEVVKDKVTKAFKNAMLASVHDKKDIEDGFQSLVRKIELGEAWEDLFDLGPAMDRAVADVRRSVDRINSAWDKGERQNAVFTERFLTTRARLIEQSNKAIEKSDEDLVKDQQRLLDRLTAEYEAGQKANAAIARAFAERRLRIVEKSNEAIAKSDTDLVKEQERLLARLTREHDREEKLRVRATERAEAAKWRIRNTSLKAYEKYLRDIERGRTDERGYDIPRDGRDETSFVDRIAGMFGRGSRSDLLHYFGKVVGGLLKMTVSLGKDVVGLGKMVKSVGNTFMEGFNSAAEGAGTFTKVMAGMGAVGSRVIAAVAASGPAIAAAMGVAATATVILIGVMSVLASVMSALTAIATGLVSTIVAGLTGGILVLGGALTAAAAAGGLLALAFTNLNDKQKTLLKESMNPFVEKMKELGQTMAGEMSKGFEKWGSNLSKFATMIEPLGEKMGRAFRRAGTIMTESLTGPGFQKLTTAFGIYLPTIITNLSHSFGGFLNGLAGMFAAIMPHVTRFSQYLRDVGTRFSEWANSAKGQNSIADFADRAVESFKSLWGALREVGGFLKDVLFNPATMEFGNKMFDGIRDSFAGFREDIKGGNLERWLDQAATFGAALWDVMNSLGGVLKTLSDEGVIDKVSTGLHWLASALDTVNAIIGPVVAFFGSPFASALAGALASLLPFVNAVLHAAQAFIYLDDVASQVSKSISGMPIVGAVSRMLGLGGASDKAATSSDNLASSATKTGGSLDGVQAAIDRLINGQRGLVTQTEATASAFMQSENSAMNFEAALDTAAAAAKQAGGNLDITTEQGRANRQMMQSLASAYNNLSDEQKVTEGRTKQARDELVRIATQFGMTKKEAREYTNNLLNIPTKRTTKVILDGIEAAKNSLDYLARYKIPDKTVRVFVDDGRVRGFRAPGGVSTRDADGSVKDYYANGGVRREHHVAQFAPAGAWRVWAEPETGGEAYIPLHPSKRSRSLDIWYETGRRLGATMFADGGTTGKGGGGPSAKQLRNLIKQINRSLKQARTASDVNSVKSLLSGAIRLVRSSDLNRKKTERLVKELGGERKVDNRRVNRLLKGLKAQNATLADYAKARQRVTRQLEEANQKLTEAIALRDDYRYAVADSVKSYGALTSAQGEVINGIQQELGSKDITSNLQTRLDAIRKFQSDLNVLLSMGLGKEAYKQLVDAGVEEGGAFAAALAQGGAGAVSEVNTLLDQIGTAGDALGLQSSNRLYQAGVDAAQGLVDGLTSLSDDLDSAAAKLGASIVRAIKRKLGIKSPSRVLMALMDDVGDGAVLGLDRQHTKVDNAAASLMGLVARTPDIARADVGSMSAPVSGNGGDGEGRLFRDLVVQTPTEDPHAVAIEAVNELVGRL